MLQQLKLISGSVKVKMPNVKIRVLSPKVELPAAKQKRSLLPALLILLVVFTNGIANEYDLPTIIKMAEQNNKEIQLARADIKTASAEKLSAFSDALPKIELSMGYNRNLKDNLFFFTVIDSTGGEVRKITQSFDPTFNNEYQVNATLRQTLLSFEVGLAIQAARIFNKMIDSNFEATRQRVISRVKTAFYLSLLLKEVAGVAANSQASAKDNYENIKIKFENGIVSEFDLLQAEVRWQNSRPETIKAQQEYQLALNTLKILAGLPFDETLTLRGSLERYPEIPESPQIQKALSQRPDYNALIWQQKLQKKYVSSQKAQRYPRLEGMLRYTYSAASDIFKFENENRNFVAGLSLSFPIFSGGNTFAQVRKAQADVDRVNIRLAESQDEIQIQLANLQLRMGEARQRIKANQKAVQTARRAYAIAQTRIDNGLSTQVELKDSRISLDQSQVHYYSAIFDYLSAYFEWELATGNVNYNGQ